MQRNTPVKNPADQFKTYIASCIFQPTNHNSITWAILMMILQAVVFILFAPLIIAEVIYIAITKGKKSTLEIYEKCQSVLFPDYVFSILLFFVSPYTASIFPHIVSMKKGSTKVQMKYSFLVKNPFNSIHAAALTNLGEFTSA
jgi:predicted membrane protein